MSEQSERFIRLDEVMSRTGLKRSTIYLKMKANEFPKSISLGLNNVAWLESEVVEWMKEKVNQRNKTE
ncbi:helix-turn-helix transcriptional regulator [Aggregatibacter actinomycetemcomitans]|uniref:helix-turn-helix transcriptional regulator n=1 Tax=Aggregatibacter actinomycetemcomitans TaxID=714 RepID=UPI00197C6905|nr:AlpA family transcriptional regulator [Aggregatibacter actinomycetemcomitans]MBN6064748.1 AlpA family transcriptional regulator [Aggregatibacter actinomycetemcomitans]MBN6076445.1 AlpA family transcriptional regulator [Aggregatibacter actinomycetemcomitans]MBN6081884.1 AlpA family transcriptional regulator [Aggregatibacter actinomycetemcomitans]MBN6084174.1 AlpA family transcriptional regulator [Aggregatibacter actinomycetemcomitans]